LPGVLHVPAIRPRTVGDIIKLFGGADQPRAAVTELQAQLYAA
jgi:hypothetical protein